jgi:hypothetical protein
MRRSIRPTRAEKRRDPARLEKVHSVSESRLVRVCRLVPCTKSCEVLQFLGVQVARPLQDVLDRLGFESGGQRSGKYVRKPIHGRLRGRDQLVRTAGRLTRPVVGPLLRKGPGRLEQHR